MDGLSAGRAAGGGGIRRRRSAGGRAAPACAEPGWAAGFTERACDGPLAVPHVTYGKDRR